MALPGWNGYVLTSSGYYSVVDGSGPYSITSGGVATLLSAGSGSGVTSGDKGDIVVADAGDPGETWTFDSGVVTAFARTVLDDVDDDAARATLGAMATDSPTYTGQITFNGSMVITPASMTTHIIDTSKMQSNEPSDLTTDTTFTLSATPAANSWFSLYCRNNAATSIVCTLPVAATFTSLTQQAIITTFTMRAGSRAYITFVYTGVSTNYFIFNEPVQVTGLITVTFDGSGQVLTTGAKGWIQPNYNGQILSATLLADQSGSIVVDVWKDTYANYPPTVADTITASAKPTISSATKSTDSTLTGWTKTFTAGDVFKFNIDSVTTITRAVLVLSVEKT